VSAPLKLRLLPFGPLQMVLAYAGVQTAAQHYRLSEQRREVQREIVELQGQLAELEGLREYLASDEYVEAVARSRFGLVRPGETAVVVEDRAHPEARLDGDGAPEREAGERWWEALFDR
jgi:cell division protein FtsB